MGNIYIRTSIGGIEGAEIFGTNINLESSHGNISLSSISAEVINISTSIGRINIGNINGETSVETYSGRIDINYATGRLSLNSSIGYIHCTVSENIESLSINTRSGSVRLNLPQNLSFNFSSRTSTGRLTTPFSDRLFNPANDRNMTQGIINNNGSENITMINIITRSGSIRIDWRI
jgi:lia operon protein LiaG